MDKNLHELDLLFVAMANYCRGIAVTVYDSDQYARICGRLDDMTDRFERVRKSCAASGLVATLACCAVTDGHDYTCPEENEVA